MKNRNNVSLGATSIGDRLTYLPLYILSIVFFIILPPPLVLANNTSRKMVENLIVYYLAVSFIFGLVLGKWLFLFCES